MKFFIIILIRLYQRFYPKKWRGKCLYHESCSNYVLRMTKAHGARSGYESFLKRYKNCRSGFSYFNHNGKTILITANREFIHENDLSDHLKLKN